MLIDVADLLESIPGVRVLSWRRWQGIWQLGPDVLQRSAAYLIGEFDELPDTVVLDPQDGEVVYSGETHGNGASLGQRMGSFGYSVGLREEGYFRHVAGEAIAALYPNREERLEYARNRLAFALIPFEMGPEYPPDARGITPVLVEAMLLHAHVLAHGILPKYNTRERVMPVGWACMPDPKVLTNAIQTDIDENSHADLAGWLTRSCSWGGGGPTSQWTEDYQPWRGWRLVPRRNWAIYLGRRPDQHHVEFSVYYETRQLNRKLLGPRQIRTPQEAARAAWAFLYGWQTQWKDDRYW